MLLAIRAHTLRHTGFRAVQRHLGAIEIVTFECSFKYPRVRVAGHPDKSRHFLIAHLVDNIEHVAGRFHIRQILFIEQTMDVQQVDVIRVEAAQAAFDNAFGLVPVPRVDLGSEEDVLAARRHQLADPRLALPVSIPVGSIDVGNPQIERLRKSIQRFILFLVSQEAAPRPERQDGNPLAGLSEHAGRHAGPLVFRFKKACNA